MCDIALAGQGLGAFTSALGSHYSARSEASSRRFDLRMGALQADASSKNRAMSLEFSAAEAGMQAAIGDINAKMMESNAQATLLSGQREEQKSQINTAQLKSTQRASMAANGIDLGVGSAENILTTTDVMGEIDANTIQANAVRAAWGYRAEAQNAKGQADVARARQYGAAVMAGAERDVGGKAYAFAMKQADSVRPSTSFGSSLLSGAGKVAESWYSYANKNNDITQANRMNDPIFEMNRSRKWTNSYA